MQAPAQAEDRDARLRDVAERVAVLTTSWEPDLKAAMQGLAPELGAGWDASDNLRDTGGTGPADPQLALWKAVPRDADAGLDGSFGEVWCFRMGAVTLRATLDAYRFTPGKPVTRVDGGKLDQGEQFAPKIRVIRHVVDKGLAQDLKAATTVLQCAALVGVARPLDEADWAALSQGMQAGYTDPALGPVAAFLPDLSVLKLHAARDPATRVVEVAVLQMGAGALAEGAAIVPVMFEVTVLRMAQGS